MKKWFNGLEVVERNYWLGLALLFVGLAWGVSIATGLTVVGGVMIVESVITSYLAGWINSRNE